jgi:AcrR family transcriptional regulator
MDTRAERDLTTRARIRQAAFRLISEKGFEALTIRETGRRAGVSASVVIHHYGSRQGLIDAISDWVLNTLRNRVCEGPSVPKSDDTRVRLARFETLMSGSPLLVGYMRELLMNGGVEAKNWFAQSIRRSAEDLDSRAGTGEARNSKDVVAEAAMLQILAFAPVVFSDILEATLECTSEELHARWARTTIELLSSPLYPQDQAS